MREPPFPDDPLAAYAMQEYTRQLGDYYAAQRGDTADNGDEPVELEPSPDLDAFLDTPEPDYVYLIDGLLERGDRVILTAEEGVGKSTLQRQWHLQSAAGVHWFTGAAIEPIRSLLVDCENSRRKVKRELRALRADNDLTGRRLPAFTEPRPEGIDLTKTPDRDWLRGRIEVDKPDLLIIGPSYKLASGNPNDEETAQTVIGYLDDLRGDYDVTLILEAHLPHAENPRTPRPKRPIGSSIWMRWPEFGLHLDKDGTITHWRGPRDERGWPTKLCRSAPWPWAVDSGAPSAYEADRAACIDAIVTVLATVAPVELTFNSLAKKVRALEPGSFSNSDIEKACDRALMEGVVVMRPGPNRSKLHSLPTESDPHLSEDF